MITTAGGVRMLNLFVCMTRCNDDTQKQRFL